MFAMSYTRTLPFLETSPTWSSDHGDVFGRQGARRGEAVALPSDGADGQPGAHRRGSDVVGNAFHHEIQRIDSGPAGHMLLLATGAETIVAVLLDRLIERVETTKEAH